LTIDRFSLAGRVVVVTGGAGLLGRRHCEALAAAGAVPVVVDLDGRRASDVAKELAETYDVDASSHVADVSNELSVERMRETVLDRYGRVDILINNAANDPKVDDSSDPAWARLEKFPREQWDSDIAVGLTGAFLCSKVIGSELARRGGGAILNIASDLAVIAPDQRLYRREGLADDAQPVKPVSYSVVKSGLIGLTRYLATYWAEAGVRVNAISPGGVRAGQPPEFLERIGNLIPLGRMAEPDEYMGVVLFLCSDAASYITGHNLVADGGRSIW
jgi:NAD(P)-dependent dehydrogenase (short-subunit alcohol dehydrogenase family)